jgi:hypothetical protein
VNVVVQAKLQHLGRYGLPFQHNPRKEPNVTQQEQPDFTVQDEGTLALLTPKTERAQAWVDNHIDPEHETWCDAVVIEHRYAADIIAGAQAHGLTVEGVQ